MAQIVPIVSEAIEATIRRLLPSQQGFGEDIQASNVITPIIDLTPTAEGSNVPAYLQQAIAYQSQTAFSITSTTTDIVNNAGFFRLFGTVTGGRDASNAFDGYFTMESSGIAGKIVWRSRATVSGSAADILAVPFDFIIFLAPGESIKGTAAGTTNIMGSSRQIADVNGTLVSPGGFTPQ